MKQKKVMKDCRKLAKILSLKKLKVVVCNDRKKILQSDFMIACRNAKDCFQEMKGMNFLFRNIKKSRGKDIRLIKFLYRPFIDPKILLWKSQ